MTQHTQEPLSLLKLEQYVLGELPPTDAAAVAEQLLHSPENRSAYEAILADSSTLPTLNLAEVQPSPGPSSPIAQSPSRFKRLAGLSTSALAVAAALVLFFGPDPSAPAPNSTTKGSDIHLSIVGQHSGPNPQTRQPGELLKLRVTCPPGTLAEAHITIRQAGQTYAPLPAQSAFPCGNLRPWPGAFALTGKESASLCLHWTQRTHDIASDTCIKLPTLAQP